MAIAFVQSKAAASSGYPNSQAVTPDAAISAGSLLVANVGTSSGTANIITVTDSKSQTWTKVNDHVVNGKNQSLWYCMNAGAGSTTITAGHSSGLSWAMEVMEFSGVATSAALDKSLPGVDSTWVQGHAVGPTASTTTADQVVIHGWAGGDITNTFTKDGAYTAIIGINGGAGTYISSAMQYKIVAASGTQSGTISTSSYDWGGSTIATFKAAASSSAPPVPTGLLVTPGNTQNALSWNAASGATSYEVHRSSTSGGVYTKISGSLVPTAPAYTDTGLTNGTTYWYKVLAVNGIGSSALSAAVSGTPATVESPSWYDHGTQPAVRTLAQNITIFIAKRAHFISNLMTQTGMPSGIAAGAWRVRVPDQNDPVTGQPNGTFSEGMGYGVELFAYSARPNSPIYMAEAKAYFDGLLIYIKHFFNVRGLMDWRISHLGVRTDTGGATDGDYDIAKALVLMSRFYPAQTSYAADATAMINAIGQYEFYPANHANPALRNKQINGDQWDSTFSGNPDWTMPDYFRPGHLRMFYEHTGDTIWLDRITANEPTLVDYFYTNYTTGFVPDSCKRSDSTAVSGQNYKYGYNSVRRPYAFAFDYLNYGTTKSGANLARIANGERARAGGNPANSRAEWDLAATTNGGYTNKTYVAGYCLAGVADPAAATWANDCLSWLAADTSNSYFGQGVEILTVLALTGEMKTYQVVPVEPPINVTATPGDGQITVAWDAISNATSYQVHRATSSGGTFSSVGTPTGTSFTDTGRTNGTPYYYKVKASDGTNLSPFSQEVTATPAALGTAPAAPTGISTTSSDGWVFLQWTAPTGATGHKMFRSTTSGGTFTEITAPTGTLYTDSTVSNGTTYYYKIKATNSHGDSAFSAEVVGTPKTPAPAPGSLAAVGGGNKVTLTWTAATGAESYRVYRDTSAVGPFPLLASPTGTSYVDTGLVNGTTYYYKVRSANSNGDGTTSSTVNATPASPPSTAGWVEVWNGTTWVRKPVLYWNGSTWSSKPVYRWTGSTWELI